jgi:hypothetical protein
MNGDANQTRRADECLAMAARMCHEETSTAITGFGADETGR